MNPLNSDRYLIFMLGRRLCIPVLTVSLLLLVPFAYGHAIVLSAIPGPHQVVKGPDITVTIRFNSRIDAKRSRLVLLAPDGQERSLAIRVTSSEDSLASLAKGLRGGSYTLRWQVLASDGHITRGEVPFRVQPE